MGGLPAGKVHRLEHDYEPWEKRIDAMLMLLWQKAGAITVDELRRNIEELDETAYDTLPYYAKWMHAITQTLLQRGIISIDELGRAMEGAAPTAAPAPRFSLGQRVRVRSSAPLGHVRTPWYCRGKAGVIERYCGVFRNPEELAYAREGTPEKALYRVRFPSHELWDAYEGATTDTTDIEIYEQWLEAAD
jgi:nitrile hydratase